jgi:hypothetical protein
MIDRAMGYDAFNPRAMSALGNNQEIPRNSIVQSQFLTPSSAQRPLIHAIRPFLEASALSPEP